MLKKLKDFWLKRKSKNMLPNMFDNDLLSKFTQLKMLGGERVAAIEFYPLAVLSPFYAPDPLAKIKGMDYGCLEHARYGSLPEKVRERLHASDYVAILLHSFTVYVEHGQEKLFGRLLHVINDRIIPFMATGGLEFPYFEVVRDRPYWTAKEYQFLGKGYWVILVAFDFENEDTGPEKLYNDWLEKSQKTGDELKTAMAGVARTFNELRIMPVHSRGMSNMDYYLRRKSVSPEDLLEIFEKKKKKKNMDYN